MKLSRLPAFAFAFVAIPTAISLTDAREASAVSSCSAYESCVNGVAAQRQAACLEEQRENRNVRCPPPPLSGQALAQRCGAAPSCGPVTGVVRPKFLVVSVMYAPPGSAGKGGASSVDYGTGSTEGTTISGGSSFKDDQSVTVSAGTPGGAAAGSSLEIDATTTGSSTQSQTDSVDIKKKQSVDEKVSGPNTDGVDHDQDEIFLLLDPKVTVTAQGGHVSWSVALDPNECVNGATCPEIVRVGELKFPSTMRSTVARDLAAYGVTQADFPTILARDPFAGPAIQNTTNPPVSATFPDPARFVLVRTDPYEPDQFQTAVVLSLATDTTTSSSQTSSDSYSVGITVQASGTFLDFLKVGLKTSDTWTWTSTTTNASSSDQSQTSSFTLVNPSPAFTGADHIASYFDTLYRTFVFVPVGPGAPVVLSGTIESALGQPVKRADVVVSVGGRRIHVSTDSHGVYKVFGFGVPRGAARVTFGGASQNVTLGAAPATASFGGRRGVALPPPTLIHR